MRWWPVNVTKDAFEHVIIRYPTTIRVFFAQFAVDSAFPAAAQYPPLHVLSGVGVIASRFEQQRQRS